MHTDPPPTTCPTAKTVTAVKHRISTDWWDYRRPNAFFSSVYRHGDRSLQGHVRGLELNREERTSRECQVIINLLDPAVNSTLLDCPCGDGRHSIALAEHGLRVIGVDLSPVQIHDAKRAAASRRFGASCRFEVGDMRDLPLRAKQIDFIINMFFSFGFFDESGNQATLAEFFRVMKPGGSLLIHTDVNPDEVIRGTYGDRTVRTLEDGSLLRIAESYEPRTKRLEGTWTIESDGEIREQAEYTVRIYDHDEMIAMLNHAGFHRVNVVPFPPSDGLALHEAQEIAYLVQK